MGETCVIRLGAAADWGSWVVVDDTGASLAAPRSGALADAGGDCRGRRSIVLIPGGQVLRTAADVPLKSGTKLTQALPFALEDVVADDVEDLHFAAGRRLADGKVPVGVIRRDLLSHYQDRLAAAGIAPSVLAADSDALVEVPSTTTLLIDTDEVLIREPGHDPIAAEPDGLEGLLELWLAQSRPSTADGLPPSRNLLVYDATDPDDARSAALDALWESLRPRLQSLEVRRLGDGALPRLAAGAVNAPMVNLLQGDFGPRTSLVGQWPRWRLAAALLAGLAVVVLGALAAETMRLKKESAVLARNIEEALRFTFPDADVSNPRAVLAERLAQLQSPGGAGNGRFLGHLRTVADALAKNGDAKLESINYRAGVIELQVRAPSADTLDSIRKLVSDSGRLKAEIQSANAAGEEILGRLRITEAGA